MKFAHLADVHLGCWKDSSMNELGTKTLEAVMRKVLEDQVDFILISGDLFDSSYPPINVLKETARILRHVREKGIPIYIVAGSHDYSPTEKTILKVFEEADLLVDVYKASDSEDGKIKLTFTVDERTGAKITGILGRIRGTDVELYRELERESLKKEKGFKIFILHNFISELKTKETQNYDSFPKSLLPEGFNYYAGGHLHIPTPESMRKGPLKSTSPIIYPGCLFPTDFGELESGIFGGYCIVEPTQNEGVLVQWREVHLIDVLPLHLSAQGKPLKAVQEELKGLLKTKDMKGKIVTLRVDGEMSSGSPADIDFRELTELAFKREVVNFFRNTQQLTSKESVVIQPAIGFTRAEIEAKVIRENLGQVKVTAWDKETEERVIKDLLEKCSQRRGGDQKVKDYDAEKLDLFLKVLGIKQIWEEYNEG